jgi:hypothetical protein
MELREVGEIDPFVQLKRLDYYLCGWFACDAG